MPYLPHVCTWLSIIITQSAKMPMNIDCITQSGSDPTWNNYLNQYESSASCSASYTMTGCGAEPIFPPTNDDFQGVYIHNAVFFSEDECIAISNFGGSTSGGIRAYARCCDSTWFPSSSVRSLFGSKSGTSDGATSSVICTSNEQIVGCTGKGESIAHDGSYSGDTILEYTKQSDTYNKCNADNGWNGNGATAYARCFDTNTLDLEYSMECITVWGDASAGYSGFGPYPTSTVSCPTTDYFMTSCSGYSAWSSLGSYNVNAQNQCVARHTSTMYSTYAMANAVCCRILQATDDPTFDPTPNPTSIPTMSPSNNPTTIIPTVSPSNVPTTIPTVTPTSYPTLYPSIFPTIYPSNNPTLYPTFFPTQNPTNEPTINPSPTMRPTLIINVNTVSNDSTGSTYSNNRKRGEHAAALDVTQLLLLVICFLLILLFFVICLLLRSSMRKKRMREAKMMAKEKRNDNMAFPMPMPMSMTTMINGEEKQKQKLQKQKEKEKQKQSLLALELGKAINIKYNISERDIRDDKFIIESDGDDIEMMTNGKRIYNHDSNTNVANIMDDEFIIDADDDDDDDEMMTNGKRVTLGYDEEIEDITGSDDEEDDNTGNTGTAEGDIDEIIIEGSEIQAYNITMDI